MSQAFNSDLSCDPPPPPTPADLPPEDPLEEEFRRRRQNALPGYASHQRYLRNSTQNPQEEEEEHSQSLTRGQAPTPHPPDLINHQHTHSPSRSRALIAAANCGLLCAEARWRVRLTDVNTEDRSVH